MHCHTIYLYSKFHILTLQVSFQMASLNTHRKALHSPEIPEHLKQHKFPLLWEAFPPSPPCTFIYNISLKAVLYKRCSTWALNNNIVTCDFSRSSQVSPKTHIFFPQYPCTNPSGWGAPL